MSETVITIDPGVHTAAAIWENEKLLKVYKYNAVGDEQDPGQVVWSIASSFRSLLNSYGADLVIIESVEFWAGSAKSVASATRGNLSLLAYIVGGLLFVCRDFETDVELISPIKWKGQLPYKALRNILKLKFGFDAKSDHEASAIGIGLNHFGKF